MARLTPTEWTAIRVEWEASPRQGLSWLCQANGGRWPVTEEAIRRRRAAEAWLKRGTLASVAEKAALAADRSTARPTIAEIARERADAAAAEAKANVGADKVGVSPPASGNQEGPTIPWELQVAGRSEDVAVAVRREIIERQRRDVKLMRAIITASIKESQAAAGYDVARFAKINVELLKTMHEHERRIWSLDAATDPKTLTDEELDAVVNGKNVAGL